MSQKLKKKLKKYTENKDLREIIAGSSVALLFKILFAVLGYTVILLITKRFGAFGLGIYNLSNTVLIILSTVCALGFQTAILRFIGQSGLKIEKVIPIYRGILIIVIPVSIIISILLFTLSELLASRVFQDSSLTFAFKICSFIIPVLVIKNINIEVFRGLKKIRLSEFMRNLSVNSVNILLILGLGIFISSYYLPVFTFSIAVFVTFLLSTVLIITFFSGSEKSIENLLSKKEMIKISSPMLVTAISFHIMGKIDTVMLGMLSTTENVGIYSVALKLASVTSYILFAITRIVAPKISELYWAGKIEELKNVLKFSARIIFFTSTPILIMLLLFPNFFLNIFGPEFALGRQALIFLVIGQFTNAFCGAVGHFLNMTGNQKFYMSVVFSTLIINIILNYFLIPRYGIKGAAIATMISKMLWNVVSVIYVKSKYDIRTYYLPKIFKKRYKNNTNV
jgi:O-antigen/teichoic acid export membrane protein